jgi:4-amino-4-deoxy-L-arabinose transferase-like glycosyltransferase
MPSSTPASQASAVPAPALPGPASRPRRAPLAAMVIAAFALRVALMLWGHTYLFTPPSPIKEPERQHMYFGFEQGRVGRAIASGEGFASPFHGSTGLTAWQPPVYPYLVGGVFKLLGIYTTASAIALLSLNCLFAGLTCIPLYGIGERIFGWRIGLWAAWLWALVPAWVEFDIDWVWDSALSTLLLCLAVWLTLRLEDAEAGTWQPWFGYGVLWGVIALTNPSLLSLLPFFLAWACYRARGRRRPWLLPASLAVLAFVAAITPWLVRDYRTFGRFIFIRDNFWAEMRYGNSEYARGIWMGYTHPLVNDSELRRYVRLGELGYIAEKKRAVLEFIRLNPEFFLQLCARRAFFFWNFHSDLSEVLSADFSSVTMMKSWPTLGFAVLAFLGLGRMFQRRRPEAWLLAPMLLVYPALYYITYPHPRYRHPVQPVMLLLALFVISQSRELEKFFAAGRAASPGPRSRQALAGLLLCVLLLAGCKPGTVQREMAYVSVPQVSLRDRVAAVYNKVGVVRNGERVEVLERRRRFVRVKTMRGEEGWMEERYLAGADVYAALQKLAAEYAAAPVQAQATARTSVNMHVAPGRDTEHLYQLKEGDKIEVLARATAERPQSGPAPAMAQPPARGADTEEETQGPRSIPEDWLLVCDPFRRTGWVLARMVDLDVPLEIAQYAEGQRFAAFFVLNQVSDGDKKVPQYLVLLTDNKDGQPWDFNQVRIFTWGVKRHRYETAYRERNLWGMLPARTATEDFGKEGTLPVFVLRVKDEQGNIVERKYKLNGPMVRRVLAPGEEKGKAARSVSRRKRR